MLRIYSPCTRLLVNLAKSTRDLVGVVAALSVTLSTNEYVISLVSAGHCATRTHYFWLLAMSIVVARSPSCQSIVLPGITLTLQGMIWLPFTHAVDGQIHSKRNWRTRAHGKLISTQLFTDVSFQPDHRWTGL